MKISLILCMLHQAICVSSEVSKCELNPPLTCNSEQEGYVSIENLAEISFPQKIVFHCAEKLSVLAIDISPYGSNACDTFIFRFQGKDLYLAEENPKYTRELKYAVGRGSNNWVVASVSIKFVGKTHHKQDILFDFDNEKLAVPEQYLDGIEHHDPYIMCLSVNGHLECISIPTSKMTRSDKLVFGTHAMSEFGVEFSKEGDEFSVAFEKKEKKELSELLEAQ